MFRKFVAVLMITLFTSACAHQAAFMSDPPGATVSVDGQAIGVTPCQYDYTLSRGASYEVTIEKDGYDKIRHSVKADEVDREARNSWLAAGLVWSPLWLGALFTKKLKDSYEFVMKKTSPTYTAKVDGSGEETSF